jgi:hypothetical protein
MLHHPLRNPPGSWRSRSWAAAALLAAASLACASNDATVFDDGALESAGLQQKSVGTLTLALSSANEAETFRLVGNLSVLNANAEVVASVEAAVDSPASHALALEPGQYGVSVGDGYFCTYSGPATGFTGCTFVRASPDPFEILAGAQTAVTLEVTLHFERGQDVTALFRTGSAEFRLAPSSELSLRCGTSSGCPAGQLCASLDGAGPQCRTPCQTSADCAAPAECVSVFAEAPAGSAPSGVCAAAGG